MRRLAGWQLAANYVFVSLVSGRAVLAEGWPGWAFWPLSMAMYALSLVVAHLTIRRLNNREAEGRRSK